jgi:hypothetical protein
MGRLSAIKKLRERGVETLNPVRYREQAALLAEALRGIGDDLSHAFARIARAPYVDRIDVAFGRSGPVALDLIVRLKDGSHCFPHQLFSEGYRDLIAVLFFVVVAKRAVELGQAKVLILDDVFQSVDATVRKGVVQYLLEDLKDWQLVITIHDRLWFEQLRTLFRDKGHVFVEHELRSWTFDEGPVTKVPVDHPSVAVRALLDVGDVGAICGAAGRVLEQASDQLSVRLGTSVTRRWEDKYTLGDLWPGIRKALKNSVVGDATSEVSSHVELRNLAGAHYNEWATSLSLDEAVQFAKAVLAFIERVWCSDCHDWIGREGTALKCRCGARPGA